MDIKQIVKINSILVSTYMLARFFIIFHYILKANIFISIVVSLLVFAVFSYLTENMWKKKGMYSLTFIFSLLATDAIVVFVAILSKLIFKIYFFSKHFIIFWVCCGVGIVTWLILLTYGYLNEERVRTNIYHIKSSKIKDNLSICVISDIHYGTIQRKQILINEIDRINEYNPDIILLAGDLTEEKTSKKNMYELFTHLSRLRSKYGVYFVHGNHDEQHGLTEDKRTYTDEEFDKAMSQANIKCIDDMKIKLPSNITIIGRNDYTNRNRLKLDELLEETNDKEYRIIVEHQPEEYLEYADSNIDMQITGHYHGAQNYPNNILYKLAKIKYNGLYNVKNMKLFVNAGFTGSQYPIRTHSKCEYLIIYLEKEYK